MLVFQFLDDPVNGAGNAERGSALDAFEWLLTVQCPGTQRRLGHIQLGLQGDGGLRAGTLADTTLDTGVFRELDLGAIRVVTKGARRAE